MNRTLLFPTAIWTDKLSINNQKLVDLCYKQKEIGNYEKMENYYHLSTVSIGGGRTVADDFLYGEEASELIREIDSRLREIANSFSLKGQFRSAGGWFYVGKMHDYHNYHMHPDGVISCIYYVKVPQDSKSVLKLKDPKSNITSLWNYNLQFNGKNDFSYEEIPLSPKESEIIFFPSWLEHAVTPSYSEEDRIILTLNFKVVQDESD